MGNDEFVVEQWHSLKTVPSAMWKCGYCGNQVSSNRGYWLSEYDDDSGEPDSEGHAFIRICPKCVHPTYFSPNGNVYPEKPPGNKVEGIPTQLATLYQEARNSASINAYTASVMACRKILMNVAVEKGAEENQSFASYVDYLDEEGYLPPDGRDWVDYIRVRANEANHEIDLMEKEDALALIELTEMLLRVIYEFPSRIPEYQQSYDESE